MKVALVIVAVPALAAARPLPAGLKVEVVHMHLTASAGGESVELGDHEVDKLAKVELSDDGKNLLITATLCGGMFGSVDDGPQEYALAPVQAKLENLAGMRAHLKKKYAVAIPHFTAAVTLDPDTPLYATNLLSAQSMAGKLDDADRTLAAYAPKNVPWFAWRLQVDSDLKAMRGRPSTKIIAAPKRGSAKSKLDRAPGARMLYSPLGLVATELEYDMFDGVPDGSGSYQLVIVDVKTGKELLTLATEATCGLEMDPSAEKPKYLDKTCPGKEAAAAAPRRKVADELLATLGFELAKPAQEAIENGQDKKQIVAPDGRKLLTDKMAFVKGAKSRTIQLVGRPFEYAFVPGGLVVVSRTGKSIAKCDADGSYRLQLEAFSDP